jgi:hypothetical protein
MISPISVRHCGHESPQGEELSKERPPSTRRERKELL